MATRYSRRKIQASDKMSGLYWFFTAGLLSWLALSFVGPPESLLMDCRSHCGACCTAPSISTPMPGLPHGKPANTPCIHLDDEMRCGLFHSPLRPAVCAGLKPRADMCFSHRDEALVYLLKLEADTAP